jgi:prevent-host-death family protein
MEATLAELNRDATKVVRPAMQEGQEVVITENGEPKVKVVPVPKVNRRQALKDLMAIGPVDFQPRK